MDKFDEMPIFTGAYMEIINEELAGYKKYCDKLEGKNKRLRDVIKQVILTNIPKKDGGNYVSDKDMDALRKAIAEG